MKVVLFDIDGTLLHSGGAGRFAMVQAFYELFGIKDAFNGISMAGKTDPLIINMALDKHNIQASRKKINRLKLRYFQLLTDKIKKDHPAKGLYQGVEEILDIMSKHNKIIIGLLTGNWYEGAHIKLSHFDINDYFAFGAFGSDASDRNDLLPIALERCGRCRNNGLTPADVVVIGDTPNDIQCAKIHGARALAVATGSFSVTILKQKGADLAMSNLTDNKQIMDWILD